MDNEALFIIIYERPCVMGCSDKEIRICKAYNRHDAEIIAKEHGKKFFKGWSITVNNVVWNSDNTAFVYFSMD